MSNELEGLNDWSHLAIIFFVHEAEGLAYAQ